MNRTLFTLVAFSTFAASMAADPPKADQAISGAPVALVLPFTEPSQGAKREWVGRALQRSLVADLSHEKVISATSAPADARIAYDAKDAKPATEAGKAAGAAYVVVGAYEVIEHEVRVTGATLDVATGKVLGEISASGNLRDMFAVQDAVAAQVKQALTVRSEQTARDTSPTTRPAGVAAAPRTQRTTSFTGSELERAVSGKMLPIAPAPLAGGTDAAFDDGSDAIVIAAGRTPDSVAAAPTPTPAPADLSLEPVAQDASGDRRRAAPTAQPLNTITGGPGNTAGGIGGNTVGGGQGLSVVATPGNVMTGGSGNIFLSGPGNFINGGAGNQIIDPYGHTMGVVWGHEINNPTPRVMQGGDGNFISGGAGITIQNGPGNTAGGVSGNTVQSSPGNSARSGAGNTNR